MRGRGGRRGRGGMKGTGGLGRLGCGGVRGREWEYLLECQVGQAVFLALCSVHLQKHL